MVNMIRFKDFLVENPLFWTMVNNQLNNLGIKDSDGDDIYPYAKVVEDLENYYGYYYVNRDYDEMLHYFRLQTKNFFKDGWSKLFQAYNDIDAKTLLNEFLRESSSSGKNWNRNRPLNLLSDEESATSTNGFSNELLDKGYNKNQVSQFKQLFADFRNVYKAYISSFGYIFCEVF